MEGREEAPKLSMCLRGPSSGAAPGLRFSCVGDPELCLCYLEVTKSVTQTRATSALLKKYFLQENSEGKEHPHA